MCNEKQGKRRYLLTDWYDQFTTNFEKTGFAKWLHYPKKMYVIIPTIIIMIAIILVGSLLVHLVESVKTYSGLFILMFILFLLFMAIIFPLAGENAINKLVYRILIVIYFVVVSVFNGALIGATVEVIFNVRIVAMFYITQCIMCVLAARITYEYSWKVYGSSKVFSNIMESVVYLTTIIGVLLKAPGMIIPVIVSCVCMIYLKISDKDTYI